MKTLVRTAMSAAGVIGLIAVILALISDPLDGEPYAVLDVTDRDKGFDGTKPLDMATFDPRAPVISIDPIGSAWADNGMAKDMPGTMPGTPTNPQQMAGEFVSHPARFGQPQPLKARPVHYRSEPDKLDPVPERSLVEYTRFGPLPKISQDGRRPSEIYARPTSLASRPQPGEPARIAILIKGMGLSSMETQDAIQKLPGPVSLSFGPYGSNLQGWVRRAREHGHEVLLELPLEPFDYPDNDPGPHTLLTGLAPDENVNRLHWLMARFTGYAGITNSMGDKFMTAGEAVKPIWRELKQRGLLFVETSASSRSVGEGLADQIGLPFGTSEIAIDGVQTMGDIDAALKKLETLAIERGLAVGVGSGLPLTVRRIAKWSKELAKKGVVLIPITAAIKARQRT